MLLMWRMGLGRWINLLPDVGGRIFILNQRGRKSGLIRRTPLNYAIVDGMLYCTAGFGSQADWYRNVLANPQVEIWLPGSRWLGVAEDASKDTRRLELLRQVVIASGLVGPLFGVDARQLNDEDFNRLTQPYRLIRIRLVTPLQGKGGPGDLIWVWIPLLVITALLIGFPRNR